MMGSQFRLQTIGTFAVNQWDGTASQWVSTGLSEKPSALVAYLAWSGGPVTRSKLALLFWESFDRHLAGNSLRQALFKIRSVLGDDSLSLSPDGVALTVSLDADLAMFSATVQDRVPAGSDSAESLLQFARRTSIRGAAFEQWVSNVRAVGSLAVASGSALTSLVAGQRGDATPVELATALGLLELWERSARGSPTSIWIPDAMNSEVRQGVDFVAGHCGANGASVARVAVRSEQYRPYVLEHTLATVLWGMPGAAGVRPQDREILRDIGGAANVTASTLTAALLDLISAVAEDAPLLILLEEPDIYSRGALRALINGMQTLNGRPVLLIVLARAGAPPVAPLYFWQPSGRNAMAGNT